MRVCILSMQKINNFGSLLQAYSLKSILEKLGHEVSFIDIERRPKDDALCENNRQLFQEEREKSSKIRILSKLSKVDKYWLNRLKIKRLSKNQDRLFEKFRINVLGICDADNYKDYDVCIIGSDEVFNCMTDSKWGFTSQLFGNVSQAGKVITLSASCGSTQYDYLPESVKGKIKDSFCNISSFSVRDKNTEIFVRKMSEKEIHIHYDPALCADLEREVSHATVNEKLPDRYCIVYSYYNRIHNEEDIAQIKRFCNRHHMEIVTVGAPQMWVQRHLVLEPFEMLQVFLKAAFVITDTFHGTIFAARYSDKFATLSRQSNINKMQDLITKLGLELHFIEEMSGLEEAYKIRNDKDRIDTIVQKQKKRMMDYLKENI